MSCPTSFCCLYSSNFFWYITDSGTLEKYYSGRWVLSPTFIPVSIGPMKRNQRGWRSDRNPRDRELGCFQCLAWSLFLLWLMLSSHCVIAQFEHSVKLTHIFVSITFKNTGLQERRPSKILTRIGGAMSCLPLHSAHIQVTRGQRLFWANCSINW